MKIFIRFVYFFRFSDHFSDSKLFIPIKTNASAMTDFAEIAKIIPATIKIPLEIYFFKFFEGLIEKTIFASTGININPIINAEIIANVLVKASG